MISGCDCMVLRKCLRSIATNRCVEMGLWSSVRIRRAREVWDMGHRWSHHIWPDWIFTLCIERGL